MNITLHQMRIFSKVAETLNMSRAAKRLFLSQPAVSMQLKQLEESLGVKLFEQHGKKLQLTEPGRDFLGYCQRIQAELQEVEQVMGEYKGVQRGTLSIAAASTISHFAVSVIADFLKVHPNITIDLEVTNRSTVLQQLESNSKDIVLMGQPPERPDLEHTPIKDNPLVVIAQPQNPLCRQKNIPLAELVHHTFVIREKGSGTREAFKNLLRTHNLYLEDSMVMNNNESIKLCVKAGLGLGVVSVHTIREELEKGSLRMLDVEGFPIIKKWHMVHRKMHHLPPVAKAFRDFLVNY